MAARSRGGVYLAAKDARVMRPTALVVVVVAVFLSAACGTRVNSGEPMAAEPRPGAASADPITSAPGTVPEGSPAASLPDSVAKAAGPQAVRTNGESGSTRKPSLSTPVPQFKDASPVATARENRTAPSVSASPSSASPGPEGGTRGGTTPKSPLLVASVGTLSGPVGGVFAPMTQVAQIWAKYINAKGGVNGHQVQVIVYDDGGDPARHRAQVQEAIERRQVKAFFMNPEILTGKQSVEYITQKRIPVIGTDGGSVWFYDSPMYFPQMTNLPYAISANMASAARRMIALGKSKVGILVCVEAQGCSDADEIWAKQAVAEGFEVVYRVKASMAQPDFTAECLGARNAGTQVLFLGVDPSSIGRIASSCARQGFRPVYGALDSIISDRMKEDKNLDGLIASSAAFPWFQSGTSATDEFHQVMRTYGGGLAFSGSLPLAWVAGKLLEKAAANLPEPPTSEALLEGLWSIKDDTLGGLTQPLTFVRNELTKPLECWFDITIAKGAWTSPDGFRQQCRPGTQGISNSAK